jgi:drug/metabolite transporter (DMT)-like permease
MNARLLAGILLALCTSLSWALGNVLMQKTGRQLGGPRAMAWVMLVGCAVAGLAGLALDQRSEPVGARVVLWAAAAGVTGVIAYGCIFYSFARAKLSLAVPLVSCWAIVAGGISVVLLHERPSASQLAGAAIVLAGVMLVSRWASSDQLSPGVSPTSARRALWAALGAGVAFGIMLPAMGQAAGGLGAFGTTATAHALGVLLLAVVARVGGLSLAPPPRSAWLVVLATGFFETLGYVFLTIGGRFAPITLLAPVASLASAFTLLAAWLFLRERPPRMALVGAILASAGIVLLAR